jgi:hypothetical protein
MRALFTITVLIAGIYLFVQQEDFDKLSQYLPQNKIDKNAETLLTQINKSVDKKVSENVDKSVAQKLEQFKRTLSTEKDRRINALEEKLASLQAQLTDKASQQSDITQKAPAMQSLNSNATNVADQLVTDNFPSEPAFAKTQYLAGGSSVTNASLTASLENSTANIEHKEVNKQKIIKRQANLQDIATRMNKTSLLALTH